MDKIKIEDKEYPFVVGRSALRLFGIETDRTDISIQKLSSILQEMTLNEMDLLYWCAFKAGCDADDKEFPYSFDEFQSVLTKHPGIVDEMDKIQEMQQPAQIEGNVKEAVSKKS